MVEVAGVHFLHPVLARLLIPGMAHLLNCLFGARQGVRREDPPVRPGPVSTFRARTHTKPFDDRHGRSASHRAARARIVIAQIRRPFFPAWEPAHRAHDRRSRRPVKLRKRIAGYAAVVRVQGRGMPRPYRGTGFGVRRGRAGVGANDGSPLRWIGIGMDRSAFGTHLRIYACTLLRFYGPAAAGASGKLRRAKGPKSSRAFRS